jgi:hypothetical protein
MMKLVFDTDQNPNDTASQNKHKRKESYVQKCAQIKPGE